MPSTVEQLRSAKVWREVRYGTFWIIGAAFLTAAGSPKVGAIYFAMLMVSGLRAYLFAIANAEQSEVQDA